MKEESTTIKMCMWQMKGKKGKKKGEHFLITVVLQDILHMCTGTSHILYPLSEPLHAVVILQL